MATSLDALNNVGPKYRYRLRDEASPGGPLDVYLTSALGDALGLSLGLGFDLTVQNIQQSVRPHLRKQYPGDTTTISVSAHTRVRSIGGDVFNNTLPGKSAYFGVWTDGPPRDQKEIQFQFSGSFSVLLSAWGAEISHTAADGENFYLRSPNGVPKLIAVTAGA